MNHPLLSLLMNYNSKNEKPSMAIEKRKPGDVLNDQKPRELPVRHNKSERQKTPINTRCRLVV